MAPQPFRVLIVDDAQSMRMALRALLTDAGYLVVGDLADGSNVLASVERLAVDIVCLDLHMPGVDGLTVLAELHAQHPEVAVIMVTADPDVDVRHRATRAGAAGFMQKPFSPNQILEELEHVASALRLLRQAENSAMAVPDLTFSPPRAVIADDSATMRRLLRVILEAAGIEVVAEACEGRQAIEMTCKEKPDVLCMDVEMPVMNGLAALAEIHNRRPGLPVMMITSRADRETVAQAARHGARGYIVKPYQPQKVEEALKKLLSQSAA